MAELDAIGGEVRGLSVHKADADSLSRVETEMRQFARTGVGFTPQVMTMLAGSGFARTGVGFSLQVMTGARGQRLRAVLAACGGHDVLSWMSLRVRTWVVR